MQITRKQIKTFNRLNEKLKTIPKFFITNYGYLLRKYSYLKKWHYIVKCQLKMKKQRVVLQFNQLKKLGMNRKKDKEGKKLFSRKLQKKCHVRSKNEMVDKSRLQKLYSEIRTIKTNDPADPVEKLGAVVKNLDTGSSKIVIVSSLNVHKIRLSINLLLFQSQVTNSTKIMKEAESRATKRDADKNVPTATENVNEQIREQLKLSQSGRRSSIPLLTNNGNVIRSGSVSGAKTSSYNSTPSYSRHTSFSSVENEPIKSTEEKNSTKSNSVTGSSQNSYNQKPKFIDSLISKLKTQGLNLPASTNDESQSLSVNSTLPEKSTLNLPRKSFECESSLDIVNDDDDQLSDHSTSSKNDFLGFKEVEAQFERPKIPGMLSTPVVKKSKSVKSAFVSEYLDNFMTENALDNKAYITAPLKKRPDEAMMYAEAKPPSLLCPQLPSDVEKPRTVAEKRQLLERKADIKYLMIENESTVYRELRKRAKTVPETNYALIRNIQQMNIPFTRDCWRATCW